MSTIKTTLIGANTYFENLEDDLFKNLELPEGLDKDVLTQNILLEGGEFEVLYANPIFPCILPIWRPVLSKVLVLLSVVSVSTELVVLSFG